MNKELFPDLIKHRHWAKRMTTEADVDKFPSIRHGRIQSYTNSFGYLLSNTSLPNLISGLRLNGKKVLGADLFGYGYIFTELRLDFSLACSLALPTEAEINELRPYNIDFLPGTLASKKMWWEINNWLYKKKGEYQTDGFGIILSRQASHDDQMIPKDINLLYWMINQGWQTLAPNGIMLTQFPKFAIEKVKPWINYLKGQHIMADYQAPDPQMGAALPAIRLDKKTDSPRVLPSLQAESSIK